MASAQESSLELEFIDSISQVDRDAWQALLGADYPFLQYDFLAALEQQGCVCAATGWQPHHLLIRASGALIGAAPLYLKQHSWGEYVFDWAWAQAYQNAGLNYYPKLLCSVPFTPATGPRLIGNLNAAQLTQLQALLEQHCQQLGASGIHWLLESADAARALSPRWALRETPQYHWFNNNYQNFDDFVATFASRKRKTLLRERRRVAEQGLRLTRHTGSDISAEQWRFFYHCYHTTYLKRSGQPGYLNLGFFEQLAQSLGEQILMVIAEQAGQPVAAALYFFDAHTLYGRYWGCLEEFDCLHFEACYYQGIEFAIERKLARFDSGAQGEHKIQRGFTPVAVYSNHWLAHEGGRAAVEAFIETESLQTRQYLQAAADYLPFKQTTRE
ncbi:GNAT family N-acetyltransferase [Simiduia sp. 21SJ11W-1]|uniref:GNAT family N-acetyltransferase n=1 Tax=Simiduia sp. 21SJ11W-1 TaxID=2909669 RepID=UPI00209E2B03|nr:GNAT family N-acetyltransferase [Simiduia sp. 21SJ11W-1]UTA47977.1 GNAT family N-acetyltransferase [Simiduia sp. 21SJ11W-1]